MIGRALIPNPDRLLAPGMFVRLRLLGSGRHQATLVPDDAIATDQDQKFVWVVDAESRARYRRVTLGPMHEGLRIVRGGIEPDDRIVVAGVQRVRPDMPVTAEDVAIDTPTAPAAGAGG
jgi:RND family efflux transporter MFP subunit